ncbi:unnamed protein product [Brassicogethes aeneus]|uniref:Nbr1 FW domain-containing protein n=1 Tax=Brassicogethes aeneus TaxID=1431903 RepID=A0A9P0BAJ5_BRAAE|nr:unnamed protein product [Brassicogethes aeneus]
MDTDNGSDGPYNGGIDQALLQQFSCMGTSDKEELINELQKLLCGKINHSTASFFLDMNNWNLQGAICSYLDTQTTTRFPSMTLVDFVANETDSVEPNVIFQKSWHITNNGSDPWPAGCYAEMATGSNETAKRTAVPSLQPGEKTILTVTMESPATPGVYQSKWRLCTPNGSYFGDDLWSFMYVTDKCTVSLTEQLSQLSELGATQPMMSPQNPFMPSRSQVGPSQENFSPDGPDSAMC